eukprot:TRINITY_DN26857_c0_g1_i1.p1 TRINITY_DN26857_c0_g1~~TRINITY_DN26857_c0_g1_i1.p1  ORF type:complete len:908 (+),score=124.92 TRINITY_DN26857_c0_g1_i1:36-2726(+)
MENEAQVRERFGVSPDEIFIGALWNNGNGIDGIRVGQDGGERKCKCWLFRLGLAITLEDGSVESAEVKKITRVVRREQTCFVKGSFKADPVKNAKIEIHTSRDPPNPISLVIPGSLGAQLGKAVTFLWRYHRGKLSKRESVYLQCSKLKDVAGAISVLPLSYQCSLSVTGLQPSSGTLKIELTDHDIDLSFVSDKGKLLLKVSLDTVLMLRRNLSKMEIWMLLKGSEDQIHSFSDFSGVVNSDVERELNLVWAVNCNSLVTLSLLQRTHHKDPMRSVWLPDILDLSTGQEVPDTNCHDASEVMLLLQTFQAIDNDNNGFICEPEFMDSLGPAFHVEVTKAVFRVFDANGDGRISFPEYLFGCRVLRLGSRDDRLQYQHRIFDVEGTGFITLQSFIHSMSLLASISPLKTPENMSLPKYCQKLFRSIDENGDEQVSVEEFRQAMIENNEFSSAIDWSPPSIPGGSTSGAQVVFGDGQWLMVTCILSGIQQCITHREERRKTRQFGLTKKAFETKKVWELGAIVREVDQPPKPARPDSVPNGVQCNAANSRVFFTDYCPEVFDDIQKLSGVSIEGYSESLGITQLQVAMLSGAMTSLHQMASSGRSGSFFFRSHDTKFIIKTLDQSDATTVLSILPFYHKQISENPDSLLTRFYGLHELQYGDQKMVFAVMQNIFLPFKEIHVSYDLKGSSVHRYTPPEKRVKGLALKDLDLTRTLLVDAEVHRAVMRQLSSDAEMLNSSNVIDYSLLLGVHKSPVPIAGAIDPGNILRGFHGGFPSCNRMEIYYVGIIDITTDYNAFKKLETFAKSMLYINNTNGVSCVRPSKYKERFLKFLSSRIVQGASRTLASMSFYSPQNRRRECSFEENPDCDNPDGEFSGALTHRTLYSTVPSTYKGSYYK